MGLPFLETPGLILLAFSSFSRLFVFFSSKAVVIFFHPPSQIPAFLINIML